MASIGERLTGGIIGHAVSLPLVATGGALLGYVYGTLASLPASAVAKAWAIWAIAENTFMTLAEILTENPAKQALLKAVIIIGCGTVGVQALRKQGLLGHKMMYVIIIIRALAAFIFLGEAGDPTLQDEKA